MVGATGYADGFVQTDDGEIIAERDGCFVDLYQVRLRDEGARGRAVARPMCRLPSYDGCCGSCTWRRSLSGAAARAAELFRR